MKQSAPLGRPLMRIVSPSMMTRSFRGSDEFVTIRRGDLTVNNPDLVSWLAYFDSNAAASDLIPWDDAHDVLTADEQTCIESSIAKFQLGEYSEGHSLLTFAAAFADELGEQRLVSITRRFIKEEQKHALMLKRFMQNHGMRTLQRNWTDTVFRRLRKYAGYEASITVLITAELIALVYLPSVASVHAVPSAGCDLQAYFGRGSGSHSIRVRTA
jgi:hypothetical protein